MDRTLLSFPAYKHLEDNVSCHELSPQKKISIPVARVTPTTGCTNNCVWCADFWKPDVESQDLAVFLKEVKYLLEERNSRYFYLGTHNFFHDIPYALTMAQTISRAAPVVHW